MLFACGELAELACDNDACTGRELITSRQLSKLPLSGAAS
jgi:hypothetical protein